MSTLLTIAVAVVAAALVVGGIVWVSMRMTDRKNLAQTGGIAQGAPDNEWMASAGASSGVDCGASAGGGNCD
jgi:hypothetical protein